MDLKAKWICRQCLKRMGFHTVPELWDLCWTADTPDEPDMGNLYARAVLLCKLCAIKHRILGTIRKDFVHVWPLDFKASCGCGDCGERKLIHQIAFRKPDRPIEDSAA
jgi:hypothetical protein